MNNQTLMNLMSATQALVQRDTFLTTFVSNALDNLKCIESCPRQLPVTKIVQSITPTPNSPTENITKAVITAADILSWQQSYTAFEVGQDYLNQYGWFNLVAPEGPFLSDEIRVSVGFWDKSLTYPRHWHQPEETYCIISGGARFIADDRPPTNAGEGDLIHHPSNLPHSMEMTNSHLLAMAFWKGKNLTRKPGIEAPS